MEPQELIQQSIVMLLASSASLHICILASLSQLGLLVYAKTLIIALGFYFAYIVICQYYNQPWYLLS